MLHSQRSRLIEMKHKDKDNDTKIKEARAIAAQMIKLKNDEVD